MASREVVMMRTRFDENDQFCTESAKSGFVPLIKPILPPNRFNQPVFLDRSGFNNTGAH
jgi:hypothetical protein